MNAPVDNPGSLQMFVAIASRRRAWLLGTFAAGVIASVLLALLWPPQYRSQGTILIEQQEMPLDLVRSTVTSYADQRIQVISKRVMTTETLLDIIRRYNLYPRQRARDTREALLKRVRADIGLKMISADVIDPRSGKPTTANIAFDVSYTSDSPDLAAKVANELTTLYLNENLTSRTKLAREATEFLQGEGDRIKQQIADLEVKLAKFKEKNAKRLPELVQLNMSMLDRTDQELRTALERQSSLQQQQVYLEAQLVQLKPNSAIFSDTGERILSSRDRLKALRSQLADERARYTADYPDIGRLEREVAGLERDVGEAPSMTNDLQRQLDRARTELAEASKRYAPEHPDRIRLQAEVASLQSQLSTAQAQHADDLAVTPGTPAASAASSTAPDTESGGVLAALTPTEADNPAFIQIRAQLSSTIGELNAQAADIAKLRVQERDYQRDLGESPQVEKEFRDLTRDYDNARFKYQEIRSKQVEARTAQDLEADRKGERFTLIDPPLPPEEPVSPNRPLVLIAGLILSIGLAVGMLWIMATFDSTVRTRADLLQLVGVPPLALVPHISTRGEARAARRRLRFALGSAVGTACIAIVLVHVFYRPLDVLWFSFTRKLGL
jgi:succinoglycan biosynthesis transport protein ExoP